MQSAASDLALLEEAAREAGALARNLLAKPLQIESKGAAGPVTNVDFAVDALLAAKLRSARPDYGWLSEESEDIPDERIGKTRVFMLDPIDGTSAMIERVPQFTICIGIVENQRALAGAVYNPMTDEMFLGAIGNGATLNGKPMRASTRTVLEGASMISQKRLISSRKWPLAWPDMHIEQPQSIAYRLALTACGRADAALILGAKHEWDIAAGAALVEAAGGRVSDPWGEPLRFNQREPRGPGAIASGAALHPLLIERTHHIADPRKAETT